MQDHKIASPLIDMIGSGAGIKVFCANDGSDSPDIANASRRMHKDEFRQCAQHGVDVAEMMIGYDGAVFAQNKNTATMDLSIKAIFLALAKKVPSTNGRKLIDNPYHYWNEVDSSLPHRKIIIYGPPAQSGTRDLINKKVMDIASHDMPMYHQSGYDSYHQFRTDGVFINDHEDHDKTIQQLIETPTAVAFFGYSYYSENRKTITPNSIAGSAPDEKAIVSAVYPLSRPFYFYFNRNRLNEVKDLNTYVQYFMSEDIIGAEGACQKIGMIPLPQSALKAYQLFLKYGQSSLTKQEQE